MGSVVDRTAQLLAKHEEPDQHTRMLRGNDLQSAIANESELKQMRNRSALAMSRAPSATAQKG
jgi:hypothetical protein